MRNRRSKKMKKYQPRERGQCSECKQCVHRPRGMQCQNNNNDPTKYER